jgi:hypothetical protein
MAKNRQVYIDDQEYCTRYGHSPHGRGGWLFCTVDPRSRQDYLEHLLPGQSGTYSEARAKARILAASMGIKVLYVCT